MSEPVSPSPAEENRQSSEHSPHKSSFIERYGSRKWLLPLLVFLCLLIFLLGTSAFMESRDSNNTNNETTKEKSVKKNKRKTNNKKNTNKRKQNRNQKKNNGGNARAIAEPGWTSFSFSDGETQLRLRYPGNLKVNINDGTSRTDAGKESQIVSFENDTQTIQMTFEPNTNNLTLSAWHDVMKKSNSLYASPVEKITVSENESLLQHTAGTKPAWHAFVPLEKERILWASIEYSGDKEEAKEIFVKLLNSLSINTK